MKRVLLLLAVTLLISPGIKAETAALFSLNEVQLSAEMEGLNKLESYLDAHREVSFAQLKESNHALVGTITGSSAFPLSPQFGIDDMQWGSFAWGFCCWPIGIFTVLLNDSKGSDHKISYFIGIGTAVVLSIPSFFIGFN